MTLHAHTVPPARISPPPPPTTTTLPISHLSLKLIQHGRNFSMPELMRLITVPTTFAHVALAHEVQMRMELGAGLDMDADACVFCF